MSKEWRNPRASTDRARCSASRMSCPLTNCSPISRIAMSIARRTSGSPPRAVRRCSAPPSPCSLWVAMSLPVISRPQAAALTNIERPPPRCSAQRPAPTLSRISASRVASSGMRSSASARHISAMPSCEVSENSCSSACTSPCLKSPPRGCAACWRRPSASRSASSRVASACAGLGRACSSSAGSSSGSGRRVWAVMARRLAPRAGQGGQRWAKAELARGVGRRAFMVGGSWKERIICAAWPNFSPKLDLSAE
jgi:hypothetical protein